MYYARIGGQWGYLGTSGGGGTEGVMVDSRLRLRTWNSSVFVLNLTSIRYNVCNSVLNSFRRTGTGQSRESTYTSLYCSPLCEYRRALRSADSDACVVPFGHRYALFVR